MVIFMKKVIPVLTLCFVLSLFSCNSKGGGNNSSSSSSSSMTSSQTSSETSSEISSVAPERVYDEFPDSVDGIDVTDLSGLKTALNNTSLNYKKETKTYYNAEALRICNLNNGTDYVQETTTLVSENYRYTYSEDFKVNYGYINDIDNNTFHKIELLGETLEDKLQYQIKDSDLETTGQTGLINDVYFGLEDITDSYIDSLKTVDTYEGWRRVSQNKYRCDRMETFNPFMQFIAPDCPYGKGFMTFDYVTIETNVSSEIDLRFRIYAFETQTGKVVTEHTDSVNKPNWYLLFAECTISNMSETNIASFETYLNSK
jgi:hypothetical protein